MELHKKVIGNAFVAYFMVFVSIFFLLSKSPYINHPFVKNHVKSAFSLHILLLGMFFLMMNFSFLDGIKILQYSLNTIITSVSALLIFGAILYGAWKAHNGKTITLGEIFHHAGVQKQMLQKTNTKDLGEEDNLYLILAHIPFLGYLTYGSHKKLPHIRDISMVNMMVTVISVIFFIFGYSSLSSIFMLAYIIWSVFQSIRLVLQNELMTLDTSIIPTAEEKYILQKSLISYLGNTLRKNTFIELKNIIATKTKIRYDQEVADIKVLKTKKESPIPTWLFYIPFINMIGVFFAKTRDRFHIINGIVITLIFALIIFVFDANSPVLLLTLFPICYGISYSERKAYRMPYVYDIYACIATIVYKCTHIFHKTRKLQKTDTQVVTKISDKTPEKK